MPPKVQFKHEGSMPSDSNEPEISGRQTVLHISTEDGELIMAELLLGLGTKVSLKDSLGRIAEDRARGNTEMVDLLRKYDCWKYNLLAEVVYEARGEEHSKW
jgi:hypothetical protein